MNYGGSLKSENWIIIWPLNPTSGHIPRENQNLKGDFIEGDIYSGVSKVKEIHKEWEQEGSNENEKPLLSLGWRGKGGTGVFRA